MSISEAATPRQWEIRTFQHDGIGDDGSWEYGTLGVTFGVLKDRQALVLMTDDAMMIVDAAELSEALEDWRTNGHA